MTAFIIRIELERKLEGLRIGDARVVAAMQYDEEAKQFCDYLNQDLKDCVMFRCEIDAMPLSIISADFVHHFDNMHYHNQYLDWLKRTKLDCKE